MISGKGFSTVLPMSIVLASWVLPAQTGGPNYQQKFQQARAAYFRDLQGDRGADDQARQDFEELMRSRPNDPVIVAYTGSLELLEAGRTWAFWNKHVLANQGLTKLDESVSMAPNNLEARFIRGASTYHLPFFFKRKQQAESDLSYVGPRAESALHAGELPAPLAAAALDYYGHILEDHSDRSNAQKAFAAAVRADKDSPGGRDAASRLHSRS